MRRVVVTGLGVVCATGHNVAEFDQSLRTGRSGLGLITSFDASSLNSRVAAEVRGYSYDHVATPSEQKHLDPNSLLAMAAAAEAVKDAGYDTSADSLKAGIVLGTGMGSCRSIEETVGEVRIHERRPRPTTIPRLMFNAAVGHLSMIHGLRGPSQLIVTACSSSAHAIGQAANWIRSGLCDSVVAGGTEVLPDRALMAAWDSLRVMSRDNDHAERSCRPFSADREGFVMGEGAAIMIIESEERALARGARIYGEVAGVGLSSDAHHLTAPQVDGLTAALTHALHDAHLNADQVQYINAHGTGTAINDPLETEAIKRVLGDHAARVQVSSTKSGHGHTIGAAGALEATATLLAINGGYVPPTLHLETPDATCDLDYIPREAREAHIDVALSNSFAFGGHNVVLALKRYQG